MLSLSTDRDGVSLHVWRRDHSLLTANVDATLAEFGRLADGARVVDVDTTALREIIDLPWGKSSQARNECAKAVVHWENARGIQWDLELRAYDDGVAFRYGLPAQAKLKEFALTEETTEFRLAESPTVLSMTCDNFTTSHENTYSRQPLAELPAGKLLDLPLLAYWPHGTAAAITEARLRDFAGMYLERPDASDSVLRVRLSPLPDRAGACVVGETPHWSPWRVVLLADRAGALVESNLALCLNDSPQGDFSWATPGKSTWHWWNGTAEAGLPFKTGMNFETHKHYIDFCARHGIAYHAVVADNRPWYVQSLDGYSPGSDTDILAPRPEMEFPRILAYAKEKGVGIRLWVHWKPLHETLEEAFAQYEEWGIRGLMVDFMDRDDQEMVQWQEQVLQCAARHKLHIQFHGSYKPTGEQRTYPNLFNREGALNHEYLKWGDQCSPAHSVNIAYTRALAGPVDYHLGGFRQVSRGAFKPRDANPLVLGTRCHHLGLYVVFENPMPMVSDSPSAYENQPGFHFLAAVPTTWDETRFVAGEPGEYIIIARRKGTDWYLGGINDWTARDVDLPLAFLGEEGDFYTTWYEDSEQAEVDPSQLAVARDSVNSSSSRRVRMASGGGLAAVFRPRSSAKELSPGK